MSGSRGGRGGAQRSIWGATGNRGMSERCGNRVSGEVVAVVAAATAGDGRGSARNNSVAPVRLLPDTSLI